MLVYEEREVAIDQEAGQTYLELMRAQSDCLGGRVVVEPQGCYVQLLWQRDLQMELSTRLPQGWRLVELTDELRAACGVA